MRNFSEKSALALFAGLGCALVALLFFSWLATEVAFGRTHAFDQWGRDVVHSYANPALTSTMRFITLFGTPGIMLPLGAIIVAWFFKTGRPRAAWVFIASLAGGGVLDIALKSAFARTRPEPFFGTPLPYSYGFPSGHAIFSVCFYLVLAVLFWHRSRSGWARYLILGLAAVLALLIGLSRIYLGVHYPSDVLAGYATALVWVASIGVADDWVQRRRAKRTTEPEQRAVKAQKPRAQKPRGAKIGSESESR